MDWTVADIVAAVAAMPPRPIVLSFSGSGHLLCYQLGAAQVLASSWAQRITKFAGRLAAPSQSPLARCCP